eukprot:11689454-Alexandrium_andersonii.AAC.1
MSPDWMALSSNPCTTPKATWAASSSWCLHSCRVHSPGLVKGVGRRGIRTLSCCACLRVMRIGQ